MMQIKKFCMKVAFVAFKMQYFPWKFRSERINVYKFDIQMPKGGEGKSNLPSHLQPPMA